MVHYENSDVALLLAWTPVLPVFSLWISSNLLYGRWSQLHMSHQDTDSVFPTSLSSPIYLLLQTLVLLLDCLLPFPPSHPKAKCWGVYLIIYKKSGSRSRIEGMPGRLRAYSRIIGPIPKGVASMSRIWIQA